MGSSGPIDTNDKVLVLFDGVCNLCNGAVQFIIKRDPEGKIVFSSLQSDFAASQLKKFGMDPGSLYSIIVIEKGSRLERSDAILAIASNLAGIWPMLKVFKFLPRLIRDGIYNLVAAYRYRVFGKQDSCMIPTPELRARFIE
jgi:predicted DCC family thiol-disulfide oxidoreductase YuxK